MDNENYNDYDEYEETAECNWCHEEYPISELKKEKYLGNLCWYCIKAIESRGERLIIEDEDYF